MVIFRLVWFSSTLFKKLWRVFRSPFYNELLFNFIDHILKGVKQLVDVGIPLDEKTERGL